MVVTQLDVEITSAEAADLTEFMEALVGEFRNLSFPRLPAHSGESVIHASVKAGHNDQGLTSHFVNHKK